MGLKSLAQTYIDGFNAPLCPTKPKTNPDVAVAIVLEVWEARTVADVGRIQREHQFAMLAENCIGSLLEKYIESKLRESNWIWCCGGIVKVIDFIRPSGSGWQILQIKNRASSENSASAGFRRSLNFDKWHRLTSPKGADRWDKLPESMRNYDMNEIDFQTFVREYLIGEKAKLATQPNPDQQRLG